MNKLVKKYTNKIGNRSNKHILVKTRQVVQRWIEKARKQANVSRDRKIIIRIEVIIKENK